MKLFCSKVQKHIEDEKRNRQLNLLVEHDNQIYIELLIIFDHFFLSAFYFIYDGGWNIIR
jgi:hypothetical protein